MDRRKSGNIEVTFKRRRSSAQDVCASATQLVSIAPTQPGFSPPRPYVPPFAARQQQQQQQLKSLLTKEERDYFMELESEQLVETEDMSRQTTPGASRAPSPGPATALQPAAADLAAAITQHLGQGTPCSEEIVKHYPRVQEQYSQYIALAAEQQLAPLSMREFYKHSQPEDRGIPVL